MPTIVHDEKFTPVAGGIAACDIPPDWALRYISVDKRHTILAVPVKNTGALKYLYHESGFLRARM